MPQLTMPNVGEGVTEGTVTRWLKHAGDDVALDEPVVEVETDKAVVEIPSPFAGRIETILVEEGEVVPIGAPLADFGATNAAEGDAAGHALEARDAEPAGATAARVRSNGARSSHEAEAGVGVKPTAAMEAGNNGGGANGDGYRRRRMYSPVVLRLAAEHDIDLALVQGTGIEGRVTRQDVVAYIENPVMHTVPPGAESGVVGVSQTEQRREQREAQRPETAPREAAPANERTREVEPARTPAAPARSDDERDERIALTPTRRTIAARMLESQQTVPPAWMVVEADVSGLVALRERRKAAFEQAERVSLTYMPFFVQAIVGALKEHALLNSAYGDGEIIVHHRYDIGVAVAAESGLVVPVLRDADRKSITGLAHELHELGDKARARKLGVEEMRGPTFTIDNTGAFGSIVSQPIVPPGQAAIITTEAVRRELRIQDDGSFAARSVMNLCISFDHRALDGAQAGAFMQAVRRRLEAYGADDDVW